MVDPADAAKVVEAYVPPTADPRPNDKENTMKWITVATPPFSMDQLDTVLAQLPEPDGLEARYVGTADGEVRIVSLWQSRSHADRFYAETLAPVLAKVLGPEPAGAPDIIGIDVARAHVRQPVA